MNEVEFKQKRLKKLKRIATTLFLSMVVLFILARWLSYYYLKELWQAVAAFAEAGMVGALADWYAVTALFKHPFGIKIPHTNLIAVKKDKFALKMGDFVQQHFFKREVLEQKITQIQVSQMLGKWLQNEENQNQITSKIQDFIPKYLNQIDEETLNLKIQQKIIDFVQNPQTDEKFFSVLNTILKENYHHRILESVLQIIIEQLDEPENVKKIHEKVKGEAPAIVPFFVIKTYTDKFLQSMKNSMNEIKQNPNHEFREKLDKNIIDWIQKLKNEPDYEQKVHKIKQNIISHDLFQNNTNQIWTKIKQYLIEELNNPATKLFLESQLQKLSTELLENITFSQKIDAWVQEKIITVIESNQKSLQEHITNTIKGWDSAFLANQIELEVGKDLQYIRINGTLVGGLIGLLLYLLTEFIPQWLHR
jgi:uncharacterized membrane-anchored protein YjiN (DUF445 family)